MQAKRKTLSVLLLAVVLLALFAPIPRLVPVSRAQGDAWLDGWNYRRAITINQTDGAGIDYEVGPFSLKWGVGSDSGSVIYLNGSAQLDFDDVRFTWADGSTLLDYAFVNEMDGINATAYVEVGSDLSADDALIYLYYGNSSVSGVSSHDNTFVDYDLGNVGLAFNWDEGSGATSIDYSGYGNNGTNVGLTYNSGIYGSCIGNFTQTHTSYVQVPDADSLSFGDDGFTWLFWLNCTKTSFGYGEEWATVMAKDTFTYEYWWTLLSASQDQYARLADGDFIASGSSPNAANEWGYTGFRWNGTSGAYIDWFHNGSLVDSDAWGTGFSGSTQTQDLYLGTVAPVSAYQYEGEIDELVLVNASLSDSLIANCWAYYPDVNVNEGDLIVRKRYLPSEPDWVIGALESPPELPISTEYAIGIALVLTFGFSMIFALIFALVFRRRRSDES